jgi:hypothetical protein
MGSTSQIDIVASPSRPTGELTAKDRINNLNAKLAALRGVSMPGDYLKQ